MVDEEYEELKLDLLEQIKEFTTRLTRMTQGDVSVDSKISSLKAVRINLTILLSLCLWQRKIFDLCLFFFIEAATSYFWIIQHSWNDPYVWRTKF